MADETQQIRIDKGTLALPYDADSPGAKTRFGNSIKDDEELASMRATLQIQRKDKEEKKISFELSGVGEDLEKIEAKHDRHFTPVVISHRNGEPPTEFSFRILKDDPAGWGDGHSGDEKSDLGADIRNDQKSPPISLDNARSPSVLSSASESAVRAIGAFVSDMPGSKPFIAGMDEALCPSIVILHENDFITGKYLVRNAQYRFKVIIPTRDYTKYALYSKKGEFISENTKICDVEGEFEDVDIDGELVRKYVAHLYVRPQLSCFPQLLPPDILGKVEKMSLEEFATVVQLRPQVAAAIAEMEFMPTTLVACAMRGSQVLEQKLTEIPGLLPGPRCRIENFFYPASKKYLEEIRARLEAVPQQ